MEGQIEVVVPGIGLPDGGRRRHIRAVAGVLDAVGQEIGHHGVRQQIHVVLLGAAAGDVLVPLLGGRAEIDDGHETLPLQEKSVISFLFIWQSR